MVEVAVSLEFERVRRMSIRIDLQDIGRTVQAYVGDEHPRRLATVQSHRIPNPSGTTP